MLLMGAAFMPAMNEYVDVGKVPAAETIAKHLTPFWFFATLREGWLRRGIDWASYHFALLQVVITPWQSRTARDGTPWRRH